MTRDPGPKVTKNIRASMSRDDWHPDRKGAEASARFARRHGEFAFVQEVPGARTPFGQFRRNTWRVRTRRPTAIKIGKTWRAVMAGPFTKRDPKLKFHRDSIRRGHVILKEVKGKFWTVTSGRGARDPKSLPEHIRSSHRSMVPAALRKVGMGGKKRRKR